MIPPVAMSDFRGIIVTFIPTGLPYPKTGRVAAGVNTHPQLNMAFSHVDGPQGNPRFLWAVGMFRGQRV